MADRRRRRAAPSDDASRADNPFAAPPEGQADQPWQPRRSAGSQSGTGTDSGQGRGGPDSENGSGDSGNGNDGSGSGSDSGRDRSAWGSHWSSKQPGRQSGGFGGPGAGGGQEGGNGDGTGGAGGGLARGMRWDPTDPKQRHARYSLHTGVWALFFALFSLPEVALLLGALSLYWGGSALRVGKSSSKSGTSGTPGASGKRGHPGGATAEDVAGTDRTADGEAPKPVPQVPVAVTPAQAAKSRRTAAVSGLVASSLALAVVAATFTFQQVYSDYFTCTQDALTQSSREDCKDLLPKELRPLLQERSSSAGGLQLN
ncbi:hypothetical protein [Streptomyces sp. WMMB 322]|uniref:hypothetical protein n=1 Tax=Streptomyces sp. WMMB 322 TaxID=1286821 RepID=UPI0006E432C4|nr:hypothetical protein [Streptomyces sp. WMMB 322]SCK28181.1 hypothetical protein H180DRAFT_02196 [Streptomyces sp. WMMB 322]